MRNANQKNYFRKQGVMVIVPADFRVEFYKIAQQQADKSLSSWLRPKLLNWLAEERPDLKKKIREYLRAEEVLRQARTRSSGRMQNLPAEDHDNDQ